MSIVLRLTDDEAKALSSAPHPRRGAFLFIKTPVKLNLDKGKVGDD